MTTTYNSIVSYMMGLFRTRPKTIEVEKEYIGKGYLCGRIKWIIMEAVLVHELDLKDSDCFFVWYRNEDGLDVRIYLSDLTDDTTYHLEINGKVFSGVKESDLNDTIITELLP
jgi:hypothetical protein